MNLDIPVTRPQRRRAGRFQARLGYNGHREEQPHSHAESASQSRGSTLALQRRATPGPMTSTLRSSEQCSVLTRDPAAHCATAATCKRSSRWHCPDREPRTPLKTPTSAAALASSGEYRHSRLGGNLAVMVVIVGLAYCDSMSWQHLADEYL